MSWVVMILVLIGTFFVFVAALGVFRMPDFYMRMHAATKAGAFGASLMMLAATLHFANAEVFVICILSVIFFYLTTPVAAQTIAGIAYKKGVPLWTDTRVDRLDRQNNDGK
jgi:monovalent cation/proton antiporter, MnhG/PhaG subunit